MLRKCFEFLDVLPHFFSFICYERQIDIHSFFLFTSSVSFVYFYRFSVFSALFIGFALKADMLRDLAYPFEFLKTHVSIYIPLPHYSWD